MGYIQHNVVIAIMDDYANGDQIAKIEALREEMKSVVEPAISGFENASDDEAHDYSDRILGPTRGINGYTTYVFAPDGSKEGWPHSELMDSLRTRFKAIARECRWPCMAHLQLGGDGGETIVVETTDNPAPR